MTISEAEHILDIVSMALQSDCRPYYHPISSLQGYGVFQIDLALKLRIANEFLILSQKDDFEKQFAGSLRAYDGIPLDIIMLFVPDEENEKLKRAEINSEEFWNIKMAIMPQPLDSETQTFKDRRFALLETPSSFGDYCKSLGANDPIYWQKIYTRLDLDYTSASPKGNKPVFLNSLKR